MSICDLLDVSKDILKKANLKKVNFYSDFLFFYFIFYFFVMRVMLVLFYIIRACSKSNFELVDVNINNIYVYVCVYLKSFDVYVHYICFLAASVRSLSFHIFLDMLMLVNHITTFYPKTYTKSTRI